MILEVAILEVLPGKQDEFHRDFAKAQQHLIITPGYIEHELQQSIEHPSRHILLVRWERLEDHIVGFRGSEQYMIWKKLLHHYYQPFPEVEHYEVVFKSNLT